MRKPAIKPNGKLQLVSCITREYMRLDPSWQFSNFRHLADHVGEPRTPDFTSQRIAHLSCGHEFAIDNGPAPTTMVCKFCSAERAA